MRKRKILLLTLIIILAGLTVILFSIVRNLFLRDPVRNEAPEVSSPPVYTSGAAASPEKQQISDSLSTPEPMEGTTFNLHGVTVPTYITDGKRYGCDTVCWYDGYGFCYNVKNPDIASFEIRLGEEVPAPVVFSEDDFPYFDRFSENYIQCGYPIYLASETNTYRIGFLRILKKPHIYGYGTYFEILADRDPEAELLPVNPQYENELSGNDGAWFEPLDDCSSVIVHPAKYKCIDTLYEIVDGSEGEPYPAEIAEDSVISVHFFDGDWPGMLVTSERFFQLVQSGYFMECPCWVCFSEGKLKTAAQIEFI